MKRNNFSSFIFLVLMLCISSLIFAQKTNQALPEVQTSRRNGLTLGEWVKQKRQTADYSFEVFVSSNNDTADFRAWNGIKVIDRHVGQPIQLIDASGGGMIFPPMNNLVDLIDFNFDGYIDFRIQAADGGAGPNDSANFYAYDPKIKRFILDKELSEMTQVFINVKNGTITSAYRDGCCHHHEDRYTYRAGRRVHFYEWDEALTANGWLETSVGRLIKGKMHYKVKRVKQKPQ